MKTISKNNVAKTVKNLTIDNLINGRAYVNGEGWQDVKFNESFYDESIDKLVDLIGGRENTKEQVRFNLRNTPFSHWSGNRFVYSVDRDTWEYVAGQDYTSEITTIRNHIKK